MTVFDYKNNAASTTTTTSLTNSATSVLVSSAAQFTPGAGKVVVVTLSNTDETLFEIVYVSAVAGFTLTITRAQDGTTGLVWPAGSKIQARLTAGILDAIDPIKDIYGSTAIGEGASAGAGGSNTVAVGASAVATGGSSVVIGKSANAQSSASYGVVIGETAVSNAQRGIVIGQASTADDLSTRAVSVGATNTITDSANAVAVGSQITLSVATDSVVLGAGAGATDIRTVVIGKSGASAADNSVAIGYDVAVDATSEGAIVIGGYAAATTNSTNSVNVGVSNTLSDSDSGIAIGNASVCTTATSGTALGSSAEVTADSGSAIGTGAISSGIGSVALGAYAVASGAYSAALGGGSAANDDYSVAIGPNSIAYAAHSMALGESAETWSEGTESIGYVPAIQREAGYFWHQGQPNWLQATPVMLASPPVELAVGTSWSTTTYQDNEVVRPTSPTANEQYYLIINPATYDTLYSANNTITEAGSQPTWPLAAQGDSVAAAVGGGHVWALTDPQAGIDIAADTAGGLGGGQIMFYPTRVGFICQRYATNTAKPFISVGNQSSATAYLASTQLTLGAANEFQWFDVNSGAGATNIIFKLVTRGTGASSKMQGRFVVEGVYLQLPG